MNTQALLRMSVLAKKGTKVHVSVVVEHAGLNLGRSNKSKMKEIKTNDMA